jgi:competence protein ComEA
MKTGWGIAFGVICGLLAAGLLFLTSSPPRGVAITLMPPSTPSPIVVHIIGAVVHPGVYALPANSRVRDVIQAAGGILPEANDELLNLAASLKDGERIAVPAKITTLESGSVDSSTAQTQTQPAEPVLATPATDAMGLININSASLTELESLPGIGPVIGQRIIDYRNEHGSLASIEEIQKVSGIGPKTFERLKDLITVDNWP